MGFLLTELVEPAAIFALLSFIEFSSISRHLRQPAAIVFCLAVNACGLHFSSFHHFIRVVPVLSRYLIGCSAPQGKDKLLSNWNCVDLVKSILQVTSLSSCFIHHLLPLFCCRAVESHH